MIHLLFSLLLFLLTACGSTKRSSPAESLPISILLEEKVSLYTSLLPARLGPSGFLYTEQCDSALFSGLLQAAAPELGTQITDAQDETGKWFRRPLSLPECYLAGESASSISRDMMTGILWALHASGDLEHAERTLQYARDNNYIMGDGDVARVLLMPNLTKQLADIIFDLSHGQTEYVGERSLPVHYEADPTDFRAHILVWQILLDARLFGGATEEQLSILKRLSERYSENPLYVAAYAKYSTGDFTQAAKLLLNEQMYPADRLPDHTNSCDYWPISRDPGHKDSGYGPCPNGLPEGRAEANGAELVVIYRLIIQDSAPVEKLD